MLVPFQVFVDDIKRLRTCGDRITGTVVIETATPILVDDLLVQLLCRVTTGKPLRDAGGADLATSGLKSNSIPYCFVKHLITTPTYISHDKQFQFEFVIPFEVMQNDAEPPWQDLRSLPGKPFQSTAGHALPPTWKGDDLKRASVVHSLEVLGRTNQPGYAKSFKKCIPFDFSPSRAVDKPAPRLVKLLKQVDIKVPSGKPRRKSIISLITSDDKQIVPMQVEVQLPSVLYAGGPIPMSVCIYRANSKLQPDPSTRQITPPDSPLAKPIDSDPLCVVDLVSGHLQARNDLRVRERPILQYRKYGISTMQEHEFWILDTTNYFTVEDQPIAISASKDNPTMLDTVYPELRVRPHVTPSFRGFSVCRKYTLIVKIRLALSGQEHTVHLDTPVVVLPALHKNIAGAVDENGLARAPTQALARRLSQETLPAYEAHNPLNSGGLCEQPYLDDPPPFEK